VFASISPWNFPLAIFTGLVSAPLAAGNAVVAKPAGQTPLIGALASN
jgi:RHH-type proline utilization regulon transcriptional repressor/proline dehydrogenase/delta 1-pyrroline-5-carboxylate dehydrogenase